MAKVVLPLVSKKSPGLNTVAMITIISLFSFSPSSFMETLADTLVPGADSAGNVRLTRKPM